MADQAKVAYNYVNQVRANPAAFAKFNPSLGDADVEARSPLIWNTALQKAAERKAKYMADNTQVLPVLDIDGQKVGMNQWMREAGYWTNEKKFYAPGTPIPSDFRNFQAGHYTQMIWKGTTEIGCGKATIQTGDLKGWLVIVCNYNPPGNMTGEVAESSK